MARHIDLSRHSSAEAKTEPVAVGGSMLKVNERWLMAYGEPDEDGGIPEGVGEEDGGEALREEAVAETPSAAGYE